MFGHALHGIMAKGNYPSMTGTSVARDFVELPSQIMENWGYEKEYLRTFAKDYRTGEPIPEELIDRIIEAKNYLAGYSQVRQLHSERTFWKGVISMILPYCSATSAVTIRSLLPS